MAKLSHSSEEAEIAARTVYWEARGEPMAGKVAVAHVIKSRVLQPSWWGTDVASVCLKRANFACTTRECKVPPIDDPEFLDSRAAVLFAFMDVYPDDTEGATHFHKIDASSPNWASKMTHTRDIGRHRFYKGKDNASTRPD